MNNLPKLNLSYWAMMLLCTTMGELIGNLLSRNFAFGYTQGAIMDVCIFSVMILIVIVFKAEHSVFYWLLILMGNIGGTNLADWVTLDPLENDLKWGFLKPLQLGTKMGSLAVLAALLAVLLFRYVVTKRRQGGGIFGELFYWIAILLSSTFGTTSGDLITNDTPLGAFGGSVFLLVLLAVIYELFRLGRLGGAATYWLALVLMHPVGATIGNYVSKPIGLNLGNVYTNVAMVIFFVIIYLNDVRVTSNE